MVFNYILAIWCDEMDRKKDIIKIINSIAGKYSAYEVFSDWIKCSSLSISNCCQLMQDKIWKDREQSYIDVTKKYANAEIEKFAEMLALLTETLEEPTDVLGQIYMEAGMGSKTTGQFFTPYHLSKMCAKLSVPTETEDGIWRIHEPSCGGGGMIIAAMEVLKERGVNYHRKMKVVAQDLDWKAVYMCHLQLSLLGIDAICVQGDTLAEPYIESYPEERVLRTPVNRGILW